MELYREVYVLQNFLLKICYTTFFDPAASH